MGEAFGPLFPPVVPVSYAVAIFYVLADTVDKAKKAHKARTYVADAALACCAIEGFDAFLWQMFASVVLPGFTIHQVVAIVGQLVDAMDLSGDPLFTTLPTVAGLATIPLIVKPLDELAEVGMDMGPRKIWGSFLASSVAEAERELDVDPESP